MILSRDDLATDYHAAGLAGLAAALTSLAPTWGGPVPWRIEPGRIELDPDPAVIRRIAEATFRFDDDGILLVAGAWDRDTPQPLRARLQSGLLGSVYQHSKARTCGVRTTLTASVPPIPGSPTPLSASVRMAEAEIAVPYFPCSYLLPQRLGRDWKGEGYRARFSSLLPNYPTTTNQETLPSERVLPLYFLAIGSFALPLPDRRDAHLVPRVFDLTTAGDAIRAALPKTLRDGWPASAEDAGLAAQLRMREAGVEPVGFEVWTYKPKDKHNRGICAKAIIEPDPVAIGRYQRIAGALPTRARQNASTGAWFLAVSPTRGEVAANLVNGRRWYEGLPDRVDWDDLCRDGGGLARLLYQRTAD